MRVLLPNAGRWTRTTGGSAHGDPVTAVNADPRHEPVYIAWQAAQRLRAAYTATNLTAGRRIAEQVLATLPTCPIPEIARLGRTLRQWSDAFLAYFDTGRANNGGTEAINGLIELHRRIARGFRNRHNYRLRMLLTQEQTAVLRSLMAADRQGIRYWPVVRRGVSEEPRSMRLGRVLWEQLEDGRLRHGITLVDEAFDSSEEGNSLLALAGEPMVGNLIRQLSRLMAQFEAVISELERSGDLSPEAIERIRSSAESLGTNHRHSFFEVNDLSKW